MSAADPAAWRAAALARAANANALIDARVADLDTLITALQAGGPAWDNLTPAQRTVSMRSLAQDVRAIAIDHKRIIADLLDSP